MSRSVQLSPVFGMTMIIAQQFPTDDRNLLRASTHVLDRRGSMPLEPALGQGVLRLASWTPRCLSTAMTASRVGAEVCHR
jgi:hypothetical protein